MAATEGTSAVRTFLIADIRGYSRYTDECGDEAAAALSKKFTRIVDGASEEYGSELVEVRGDEALLVFASARAAIRAGVDLQALFREAADELEIPLRVGIGIDSGEAVKLDDGSFRGAALNVAARLCGRAAGGEVIISEATSRLAGRLNGLHYAEGGRLRLKNIAEPVHVYKVYSELDAPPPKRWASLLGSDGRALSLRLALLVTLIAAVTAAAVVYLTAGEGADRGGAAPGGAPQSESSVLAVVPVELRRDCVVRDAPRPPADETVVCDPIARTPDLWEISAYRDGDVLSTAYDTEYRRHGSVERDTGHCNGLVWGGEGVWEHGPKKPGGRFFCFFDGNDAVIVWTHERLNQPSHFDIMVTARASGIDHVGLTKWWRPWHHVIGKAG
jgi:class 3 adenylate cyclase